MAPEPVRTFFDVHTDENAVEMRRIDGSRKEVAASQFGITDIPLGDDGVNDNEVCFFIAPDARAVRKYHVALGIGCGEVHEVSGLM